MRLLKKILDKSSSYCSKLLAVPFFGTRYSTDLRHLSRFPLSTNSEETFLHVMAVCHLRFGELRVFIQSWLNQTDADWCMTILHDGFSAEFEEIMCEYATLHPNRFTYYATSHRYNDYGHTLRELGLSFKIGSYTLLTNADNYFIPRSVEFLKREVASYATSTSCMPHVVLFDMVHSHCNPGRTIAPPYSFFEVSFEPFKIDMSSAIVDSSLASTVGFDDKSHGGDQTFFNSIKSSVSELHIAKVNSILLVHN